MKCIKCGIEFGTPPKEGDSPSARLVCDDCVPNIKLTTYGPGRNVIKLEDDEGTFVDIEGTNEVPEIFTKDQFDYLAALTGHTILRDLKGELLNIIEGIGLPEKQERAIKRSVTNALHEWHHRFKEDIEIVLIGGKNENIKYNTTDKVVIVCCHGCDKEYRVVPGAEYPKCHGKYMTEKK